MNAFRKSLANVSEYTPVCAPDMVDDFVTSEVVDGNSVLQHVEHKVVPLSDVASRLVLPTVDEYSLAAMLRSGQTPQEVNTRGLIASDDVPDVPALLGRLKSMESDSVVSPAVDSPSDSDLEGSSDSNV